MVVKTKNLIMATAGIAMALNMSSCNKESETDKLVGQWNLVQLDGQNVDPDYEVSFRFDEDRDMRWCYEDSGDQYCYGGEWDWTDGDKDEIEIEISDGSSLVIWNLEIDELDDDVLEGDLDFGGGDVYAVEFEKVD